MIKRSKQIALISLLLLSFAAPGWGEEAAAIKERARAALLANNYVGDCTVTSFRFGRRRELSYRIWVKDNYQAMQVQSPFWQRGEVMIQGDRVYYYIIPGQNSALKVEEGSTRTEVHLQEWGEWLDRVSRMEGSATMLGQEAIVLGGNFDGGNFKLWVLRNNYLPVALEYYKQKLLNKSIRFSQMEVLAGGFNPQSLIPTTNTKWYSNKRQFWQAVSIPRIQAALSFPVLQPDYLPAGFSFEWATVEELSSATVAELIYEGPGHRKILLFEREKLSDKQRLDLESLKRADQDGRPLQGYQWFDKQVHLALLGEVSVEELKKIAASVH